MDSAFEHGTREDAGRRNRKAVLREIVQSGPVTRNSIATRLDLTAGAVSRIVRPLIECGLVRELPDERSDRPVAPGRRHSLLTLNPRGGQVLGIDFGLTFQTITLSDIGNGTIASIVFEPVDDPGTGTRSQESGARVPQPDRRTFGGSPPPAGRPNQHHGHRRPRARRHRRRAVQWLGALPVARELRRVSRSSNEGSINGAGHRTGRAPLRQGAGAR